MNFGRAFSYMFEDTDWLKKVGIAAAVMLIPVIGPIILGGWGLEITRRVIFNDPQPLPGWDDFGSYVSKGFQAFVVMLAYLLPFILFLICGQALMVVPAMAIDDPDIAGGLALAVMSCSYCLAILLGLVGGLLLPAAIGNLAATGELGAAFRFNEVFGLLRAAIGPYILSVLLVGLVATLLSPVGSVLCGIGVLITTAYISAVSSHLYGQAYKIAHATMA
jgi:hypothetical protein